MESNVISSEKLANSSVTSRTLTDGSIQLRHLASTANLTSSVDTVTANVNTVQANVNAQRANVNTVSSNVATVAANTIQNKANVDIANANTIQINSNLNIVSSNTDAVEARRVANLVSTTFSGQVNMSDDLIIAGNLVISGDTTTANTVNMVVQDRLLMLANSAAGTPAGDVGLLFNRGNQGNAAFFYDESSTTFKISDTKDPSTNTSISPVTAGNLDVGIVTAATIKYNGADLNTSITDNVAALTKNINTLDANADAIESRRGTNVAVAASNDFVTFTRLTANLNTTTGNINIVSANVEARNVQLNANLDIVQDNVAALGGGGTFFKPFMNVNSALGSSNVFFVGQNTADDANVLTVTLDGVVQANTEFVMHHSNDTIQFKDSSIPSGTKVTILSMIGVA
jgi:hypothetical protein